MLYRYVYHALILDVCASPPAGVIVSSRVLGRRKLVMKSADIARVYLRGESRMTPVVVEGSELSGLKAVTQTQYALSIHLYMFLVTSELWLLFRRLCPLLGSRTQAFYSLGFAAGVFPPYVQYNSFLRTKCSCVRRSGDSTDFGVLPFENSQFCKSTLAPY